MSTTIRKMLPTDRETVLEMMRVFYASPAVMSNGSEEIFRSDIDHCLSDSPYLEGFVFEDAGSLQGYGMLAHSFSTEFGKPCVWLEDLYICPDCRGLGIGGRFLQFVAARHPEAVLRLEVEEENTRAVALYEKSGFRVLPYMEMLRR